MALTFNDTLAELFYARVTERMTITAEELASGSAHTWERYQWNVGHTQGMRDAMDILAEVQKTLAER